MKTLKQLLKEQQEEVLSIDGLLSEIDIIKAVAEWLEEKQWAHRFNNEKLLLLNELFEELKE